MDKYLPILIPTFNISDVEFLYKIYTDFLSSNDKESIALGVDLFFTSDTFNKIQEANLAYVPANSKSNTAYDLNIMFRTVQRYRFRDQLSVILFALLKHSSLYFTKKIDLNPKFKLL